MGALLVARYLPEPGRASCSSSEYQITGFKPAQATIGVSEVRNKKKSESDDDEKRKKA
jgi:hypothetical protein